MSNPGPLTRRAQARLEQWEEKRGQKLAAGASPFRFDTLRWHLGAVLLIAALFTLFHILDLIQTGSWKFVAAVFLFGTFCGVIVIADEEEIYATHGVFIRTFYGIAIFPIIFWIAGATAPALLVSSVLGGVLGYFGMRWLQHI